LTPTDIPRQVVQQWADRRRRNGRRLPRHDQLLFWQQMDDVQRAMALLTQYTVGGVSLRDTWLQGGLEKVLGRYEEAMGALDNTCAPSQLSEWLAEHYHPRLLEELTVERFACSQVRGSDPPSVLAPALLARFEAWVRALRQVASTDAFQDAVLCEAPFLSRMLETLQRFEAFLWPVDA
jgi:hypothetical protein